MYPHVVLKINILMRRNIIIYIGIRNIIIIGMVIAYRPPFGLAANVKT